MTLWSLMRGEAKRTAADIDSQLVALIERERDAASLRGIMLTQLRNRIIAMAAKARKQQESRDAA